MELIHIVRTRHVQSINSVHRLNMGVKSKTFQIVKEHTRRQDARKNSRLQVVRCSKLVEPTGIEPVTFWLQTRRSPS